MNFLEAKKTLAAFDGGPELAFLFAMSGSSEPFDLYLRAAAAKHGRAAKTRTLPFNTLAQTLRSPAARGETEVHLLLPSDFVTEADWRSGVSTRADENIVRIAAEEVAKMLQRRNAKILYLPAPLPPLLGSPDLDAGFAEYLKGLALSLGATILPVEAFAFGGYLSSGCPVGGAWIGKVAEMAVSRVLERKPEPKKVLVTDLDNVMWKGGIAEDGLEGVYFESQGHGFVHFLYQTLLKRLASEGVLLAAVSRNDAQVVEAPFKSDRMVLKQDDFVAVVASYHAKSAQIAELATRLNLGLDSFVFVDDNPIELTEVRLALPAVRSVQFPSQSDAIPAFLNEVASLFVRDSITTEDRERTALYRRRLEGMAPSDVGGADISGFLRELGMTLTLHDRSLGDRTRVVQLINKTNQFNLNGKRITDEEVTDILAGGGRLYGATLADRTGSHGEILACLIDANGMMRSFVMSCRVFQRRVEYAFLAWLLDQPTPPRAMDWVSTARNEPFATFLSDVTNAQSNGNGIVDVPATARERFVGDLAFFELTAP